ncbi:MAG TPA: methyltransferase domain-containing protein [Planctomycetota bacterium]
MEPLDADPTRRFSDRAEDYARYRPGYPAEAIDAILAGLRPPSQLVVVDVGAGTGISTRLLADRGPRVLAVEPNAAMRAAAAAHPRVTWVDGTAEATRLPAAAHDVAVVAQAFHWFDAPVAVRELHRILRQPGRLSVLWNRRSREDAFTLGYCMALEAIDGEAPAERNVFDPGVVTSTGLFTNPRTLTFHNAHALTEHELIGRAMSTSTVPRSGPRTEELLRLLHALHGRHRGADGRATMVYRTEVHLWDR